jgi:hypothetical protein
MKTHTTATLHKAFMTCHFLALSTEHQFLFPPSNSSDASHTLHSSTDLVKLMVLAGKYINKTSLRQRQHSDEAATE